MAAPTGPFVFSARILGAQSPTDTAANEREKSRERSINLITRWNRACQSGTAFAEMQRAQRRETETIARVTCLSQRR